MISPKGMIVTQVKNGWILELPRKDQMAGITAMIPGILKSFKGSDVPGLEDDEDEEMITGHMRPLVPMDPEIYVFATFRELMGFIEVYHDESK